MLPYNRLVVDHWLSNISIWDSNRAQLFISSPNNPGHILLFMLAVCLLATDTKNLSVRQKLTKYDIATFSNYYCQLPFLATLKMANFDVQTSFWGLEVSEFNQESISEV